MTEPFFGIYLRALEPEDYKTSVTWRQDDGIWSMVVGRKYFVSAHYERSWMTRAAEGDAGAIRLAVCLTSDHKHIGNAYLTNIDFFNRQAASAILIGERDVWGQGHATQAILLLLRHAFMDLGLERIEARQLLTNRSSIRVHEKCGFRTEGVLRRAALKDGALRDINLMACLREDFLATWSSLESSSRPTAS